MHIIPNSYGVPLREFNTCHAADSGRFCTTRGSAAAKGTKAKPRGAPKTTDKGVIQVRTVDEAIEHILAGRDVELATKRAVNTVISKLADMANEAKRLGKDAPNYDLCKVSVKGTNVFCTEKFRSAEYPDGVPRAKMPQMGGWPVPGSDADKLPKSPDGSVNGTKAFIEHLKTQGITVKEGKDPAAKLKASQAELVGAKVAGMMTSKGYDPAGEPIFVSRDDYVIDGHHRWAAVVGRDAADGRLGGLRMKTIRVDAPISKILRIANSWAKQFGIAAKAAGAGAKVT